MRLDGSSHAIVTKTVQKTLPGGVGGVSGEWRSSAFLGGVGMWGLNTMSKFQKILRNRTT